MKVKIWTLALLFLIASCGINKNRKDLQRKKSNYMFEIAINQSKEGQHQTFLETREKFVEVLGKEDATLNEGKWKPFFTVVPDLELDDILVGMTHWNSIEGFGEAAARLMPQQVAIDYFSSFNSLAYALLQPLDEEEFDMDAIKKEGMVIEFAIRKGKTSDAFGEKRETFFNSLTNYDGYKFAKEFNVYKLTEQGTPSLAENTQAVIIVWENAEKFQAAAQPIFGSKEFQEFSVNLDVETYFATSPTK